MEKSMRVSSDFVAAHKLCKLLCIQTLVLLVQNYSRHDLWRVIETPKHIKQLFYLFSFCFMHKSIVK